MSTNDKKLKQLGEKVYAIYSTRVDQIGKWLEYLYQKGIPEATYDLIYTRINAITTTPLLLEVEKHTEAELMLVVNFTVASCYGVGLRCLVSKHQSDKTLIATAIAKTPEEVLQILPMDLVCLGGVETGTPMDNSYVLSEFFYSASLH